MLFARHHRGPFSRLISTLLLGASSVTATAAETQTAMLSEEDFFGNVPVVLSGTRLPQPKREVPSAITVIDRELIEASGARDIPELFRLVAGFQVSYDDGYSPFASYHGMVDEFARRMQILVDGRSVYMPFDGGVDWSDLPLTIDDIERIEVIRGPNSATYGANAFLGVVNIITRHASETIGAFARVNRSHQDFLRDVFARYGGTTGDFDYRLTVGLKEDGGFPTRQDDRQNQFISLRGDYRAGLNDIFTMQAGYTDSQLQSGHIGNELDPPHDIFVDSDFLQLRWWHNFAPDNELQVQFFRNRHDQREDFATDPIDVGPIVGLPEYFIQIPINYDVLTERYDLEVQHTLQPTRSLRAVWGGSGRLDRVKSSTYMNTDEFVENELYRLFGNLEWRWRSWTTNLGAMYEGSSFTGPDLSPRLAVNYSIGQHHALRASVSSAIRNPVLFEEKIDYKISTTVGGTEYYNRVALASGGLVPEKIVSREVGYLYDTRALSLDVKIFNDSISDLITAFLKVDPNDIWQDQKYEDLENGESATIRGAETQIDYRYSRNGRLFLGYAYIEVDSSDNHREFSDSVPRNSGSILISQRFADDIFSKGILASAGYYYYDGVDWLSEGDSVDDVHRLDFRLAQHFKIARMNTDIAFTVQNILGPYIEFRDDGENARNEFRTRAFLSLAMEFL